MATRVRVPAENTEAGITPKHFDRFVSGHAKSEGYDGEYFTVYIDDGAIIEDFELLLADPDVTVLWSDNPAVLAAIS